MTNLIDLEEKLKTAEERRGVKKTDIAAAIDGETPDASRAGAQAGMELVAAIVLCTALGIALDRWLATSPLFLLIFFFLGLATGFYNVYRVTNNIGTAVGASKPAQNRARTEEPSQNDKNHPS